MRFGTDGVRGVRHHRTDRRVRTRLGLAAAACCRADGIRPSWSAATRVNPRRCSPTPCAPGSRPTASTCVRLGVVPTPLVAFDAQRRDALGAVVSASHNPYRRQRHQAVRRGGVKLTDALEAPHRAPNSTRIAAARRSHRAPVASVSDDAAADPDYVDHVLAFLEGRRLDGCASCSTPPTAPRGPRPVSCSRGSAPRSSSSPIVRTAATSTTAAAPPYRRSSGRGRPRTRRRRRHRPRRRRRPSDRRRPHRRHRRRRPHPRHRGHRSACPGRTPQRHRRRHRR